MKRLITAFTFATVTASSAFAVTTPEDRAFETSFRASLDHKMSKSMVDAGEMTKSGGAVHMDKSMQPQKASGNGGYNEGELGGRR